MDNNHTFLIHYRILADCISCKILYGHYKLCYCIAGIFLCLCL